MSSKIKTIEDLAHAVIAKVHHHESNCRCRKCHKESLQCLDCPECSSAIEAKILELMRSANTPK